MDVVLPLEVLVPQPVVLDALVLSLFTTTISLVITLVLGLPLAFVLARRAFRGKSVLEAVVDLPIVLPPSVKAGLEIVNAPARSIPIIVNSLIPTATRASDRLPPHDAPAPRSRRARLR